MRFSRFGDNPHKDDPAHLAMHESISFSVVSKKVEKIMRISNLRFKKNSLASSVYKQHARIGRMMLKNQDDLENFVKSDKLKRRLERVRLLTKKVRELEKEIEQAK